ncbi:hypothetical protein ACQP1K_16305 [Sphaerimonospora sp. CA-214678]|uniref:hypothetical protein n=1 Tax=Sphaerimonospora sp. CA-214678 TaxID=3240029 RepID=UPI003D8CB432
MTGLRDRPDSGTIFTIDWEPGSDTLIGLCHCGARRHAEDPIELWAWLLRHPVGHESRSAPPGDRSGAPASGLVPAR